LGRLCQQLDGLEPRADGRIYCGGGVTYLWSSRLSREI
jgi:hypothetical protein